MPPSIQTASAVEAKVKDGTITASPGFNPSAIKPKRRASVPLEQHKTYFDLEEIGYSDHSNPYEDNLLTTKLAIFQGIDVLES